MAQATLVSNGNIIDYTPSGAVAEGDVVVLGELIGVATRAIAADALGALHVSGLFAFAKGSGAINVGVNVYWADSANQATTSTASGANKFLGRVAKAAASGDSTVLVLLNT